MWHRLPACVSWDDELETYLANFPNDAKWRCDDESDGRGAQAAKSLQSLNLTKLISVYRQGCRYRG